MDEKDVERQFRPGIVAGLSSPVAATAPAKITIAASMKRWSGQTRATRRQKYLGTPSGRRGAGGRNIQPRTKPGSRKKQVDREVASRDEIGQSGRCGAAPSRDVVEDHDQAARRVSR